MGLGSLLTLSFADFLSFHAEVLNFERGEFIRFLVIKDFVP